MLGPAICLANRRDGVWNKNAPVASPQSDTLRATGFFFVLRMKRGREAGSETGKNWVKTYSGDLQPTAE